jgi:DNA-binding Xre family transcriptional regulator
MLTLSVRKLIDEKTQKENRKFTIGWLAKEIGYTPKIARAAYYGTDSFTGKQLERWCAYLDCQPQDILEYTKEQS